MGPRFDRRRDGTITVELADGEREFLLDLMTMLDTVGADADDPGARRLDVPVYLGDEEATGEWRRLMGDQLEEDRVSDRATLRQALIGGSEIRLDDAGALSVLRVINEARLVLAARLGIEVEADYEGLDLGPTIALHALGLLLEDLTEELGRSLD